MIIGIDLGTTNSLVCAWVNGKAVLIPNEFGDVVTPSVVSVDNDSIVVGKIAKQRLVSHPEETIASFKRFMGTNRKIKLGKYVFTPSELSSFVIKSLISDAENFLHTKVEEIIVSVPAYFNNRQRNATKLAGQLAGVKIERIINEPTAAALSRRKDESDDKTILVFDFGGGTLDVSIVEMFENIVEISAISGNNHLGGDDINKALLHNFMNEFNIPYLNEQQKAIVIRRIEHMKRKLEERAVQEIITIEDQEYLYTLDNKKIIESCGAIFQGIRTPINKALIAHDSTLEEIDEIMMVGGSSKMKIIQEYLKHVTNKEVVVGEDSDYRIALGCGVIAGIKMREESIKDIVLTDVCPFSLGVDTYNEGNPEKPFFSPIIERNSVLPTSKESRFYTVKDNQKAVLVEVYQGEQVYAKDNELLGEIECAIPSNKVGKESIDVRFSYDINGILEIDVTVVSTQKKYHKLIIDSEIELTSQEIEERIQGLSKLKTHPKEQQENRLLLARAERLYQEVATSDKMAIQYSIEYFWKILQTQELRKIERKRKLLSAFYDTLEKSIETYGLDNTFSIDECLEKIINDLDAEDEVIN